MEGYTFIGSTPTKIITASGPGQQLYHPQECNCYRCEYIRKQRPIAAGVVSDELAAIKEEIVALKKELAAIKEEIVALKKENALMKTQIQTLAKVAGIKFVTVAREIPPEKQMEAY